MSDQPPAAADRPRSAGADPSDPAGRPGSVGPADARPPAAAPREPAAPAPPGEDTGPTGHQEVDALLMRLRDVDALPTAAHPEVYEDVHRGLRDTLAALDTRPGPPAPVPPGHRAAG